MRILVTGAANPTGAAITQALLDAGHQVRIFGVDAAVAKHFKPSKGTLAWYAGHIRTAGSIEPALSERQVLVHAANLDEPGKDAQQHAVHIEKGTLFARYGAEREQLDHFLVVGPSNGGKFAASHANALASAKGVRGTIQFTEIVASSPAETAAAVVNAITRKGELGKQPGRETDAVTA